MFWCSDGYTRVKHNLAHLPIPIIPPVHQKKGAFTRDNHMHDNQLNLNRVFEELGSVKRGVSELSKKIDAVTDRWEKSNETTVIAIKQMSDEIIKLNYEQNMLRDKIVRSEREVENRFDLHRQAREALQKALNDHIAHTAENHKLHENRILTIEQHRTRSVWLWGRIVFVGTVIAGVVTFIVNLYKAVF